MAEEAADVEIDDDDGGGFEAAAVSRSSHRRPDHMSELVRIRRESMRLLFPTGTGGDIDEDKADDDEDAAAEQGEEIQLDPVGNLHMFKETLELDSPFVRRLQELFPNAAKTNGDNNIDSDLKHPTIEIRLRNVNYKVPIQVVDADGDDGIKTIYNSSPIYKLAQIVKGEKKNKKKILAKSTLTDINIVLKPKKMYLILGPPQSGKTTLLQAIAGRLPIAANDKTFKVTTSNQHEEQQLYLSGQILYNNLVYSGEGSSSTTNMKLHNLVTFVGQSDIHSPRLTVAETLHFANRCKDDAMSTTVALTLEGLGLTHVQDTFVGNDNIRGVSGGQRRRVTLGEMLVAGQQGRMSPILCADELSTGLDAASTVEIVRILSYISRVLSHTTVLSLLQPSPEAVALFDEIILLGSGDDDGDGGGGGRIIYMGPTEDACTYFRKLGYVQPESMDDADYLLAVASSDRKQLYQDRNKCSNDDDDDDNEQEERPSPPLEVLPNFRTNDNDQQQRWEHDWSACLKDGCLTYDIKQFMKKYQSSFWKSVWLNLRRSFILWTRDRIFIRACVIKNIAMGMSVGFVFQNTNLSSSFFGVLFQGNLFIMLGAMTSAPEKINDRAIFYKHADSNFYPALCYVLGQALSSIPQMMIDVLLFGTFVYWLVGFVASAKGFILYLTLFFSFNFTCGQMFGVLVSIAPNKSAVQAGGAFLLLLNVLFCGYIVAPSVIPSYYIWIYWLVPLSWVYRALLLNEFLSDDYPDGEGEEILKANGILYTSGAGQEHEEFTREWIVYCFIYLIIFVILCMLSSAACLHYRRMEHKPKRSMEKPNFEGKEVDSTLGKGQVENVFVPVTLSFRDLSYVVKASTGTESLSLLKDVCGIFEKGRMCALMGESGAGKTTLMDVIALRKGGGDISGDVLLNGYPQESIAFRRCSGYVEQFDVQSAELTVRETILFSAQLRLDPTNPVCTEGVMDAFVDNIINILELTPDTGKLVGSDEDGGLTFEQKKRLSIAVELAASPSIIFLDEPTSGLDARAAMVVMKALRTMCDLGRTVVATIHQPNSSVFDMFDDLLLLKKGGETVFFGDLGDSSCKLVSYFECLGATKMNRGENPASWMLNVLGQKIMVKDESLNFAKAWIDSSNYLDLRRRLVQEAESQDEKLQIKYDTEFAASQQRRDMLMAKRIVSIYWRSPSYQLSRLMLSMFIALLLGSVFIPIRTKLILSESEITSMLSTIFISFIIIGVLSITSVLPVMLSIRDMYYRHKAAGMLDSRSVGLALAHAEKYFILMSALLFCIVFLPSSGIFMYSGGNEYRHPFDSDILNRFINFNIFWGFFAFNTAIYSYIGQLFMCLVRETGTALILSSVFIGINNFFSGLIVRPQQMMGGLWEITYWINPGHYVYEGLCMSMFRNDDRMVIVERGSDYYSSPFFDCVNISVDGVCQVSVSVYVDAFFGGLYKPEHLARNAIILGGILLVVRLLTFVALKYLSYSGK